MVMNTFLLPMLFAFRGLWCSIASGSVLAVLNYLRVYPQEVGRCLVASLPHSLWYFTNKELAILRYKNTKKNTKMKMLPSAVHREKGKPPFFDGKLTRVYR